MGANSGQADEFPDTDSIAVTTLTDDTAPRAIIANQSPNRFQTVRARFRDWRRGRPFGGAILMIIAAIFILYGPVSLLRFAFLPGSTIWAALLVGLLLLAMGLIQLFAPSHALITGAVGMVLSLVSLIVALGGFGIGMLLGLAGGALGIAWRQGQAQRGHTSRKAFAIAYGAALVVVLGLVFLVAGGVVAMAADLPMPFTVHNDVLTASSMKLYPGLSQADNQSPVGVVQMSCTIKNLVISKTFAVPIFGNVTLSLKAGQTTPATLNGLTIDAASLASDNAQIQNLSINGGGTAGFEVDSGASTLTNVNINSSFLIINSITLPGFSFSLSH